MRVMCARVLIIYLIICLFVCLFVLPTPTCMDGGAVMVCLALRPDGGLKPDEALGSFSE